MPEVRAALLGGRTRLRLNADSLKARFDLGELMGLANHRASGLVVCPFHADRTPSCSVDRQKGVFHCFGCGAAGDTVDYFGRTLFGDAYDRSAHFSDVCRHMAGVEGGSEMPAIERRDRVPRVVSPIPEEGWRVEAATILGRAQLELATDAGKLGREYLEARGINLEVAETFKLGFMSDANGRPALVIPWLDFDGTTPLGLRFRHLDGRSPKATSLKGSNFRSLFGLHCLRGAETLVAAEGELNALSIWQVLEGTADVVSIGSQGSRQSIEILRAIVDRLRPRRVAVWLDEEERCLEVGAALRRTTLIKSPHGMDANDLLREGPDVLRGLLEDRLGIRARAPSQVQAQATDEPLQVKWPPFGEPLSLAAILCCRHLVDRKGVPFNVRPLTAGEKFRSRGPLVMLSQRGTIEIPVPMEFARRWLRPAESPSETY